MTDLESKKSVDTKKLEDFLRANLNDIPLESPPEAYRQNLASVRVKIVSDAFRGLSLSAREKLILPVIRRLPEETQEEITMLLLLTPNEVGQSLADFEFTHPSGPQF